MAKGPCQHTKANHSYFILGYWNLISYINLFSNGFQCYVLTKLLEFDLELKVKEKGLKTGFKIPWTDVVNKQANFVFVCLRQMTVVRLTLMEQPSSDPLSRALEMML